MLATQNLETIYQQAEELIRRNDAECDNTNGMDSGRRVTSADVCTHDGPNVWDTAENDLVCVQCGMVTSSGFILNAPIGVPRLNALYSFMSHFGEKMSQAIGATPEIPPDLLVCILQQYQRGCYSKTPGTFNRDTFVSVLRDTQVPSALQIKYQSKKYRRRLCRDLHRQKYYGERWVATRRIIFPHSSQPLPTITYTLLDALKETFKSFVTSFREIGRHGEQCDGKNCTKATGCLRNIPPYYFIFGHLFQYLEHLHRNGSPRCLIHGIPCSHKPDLFRTYMPYMPCLTKSSYKKYNNVALRVFRRLGWQDAFKPITYETPWTYAWVHGQNPHHNSRALQ